MRITGPWKNFQKPPGALIFSVLFCVAVLWPPKLCYSKAHAYTTVYNFSQGGGKDKWVYTQNNFELTDPPAVGPVIEGSRKLEDYSGLAASDDRWLEIKSRKKRLGFQLFAISIKEELNAIDSLLLTWEGHAQDNGLNFYLWNFEKKNWEKIDTRKPGKKDSTITAFMYAPVDVYLQKRMYVLVTHKRVSFFSKKLRTDFIECIVYSTDKETKAPRFALPAAESKDNASLALDFTLPEPAAPGKLQMVFSRTGGAPDSASPHVLTFSDLFETPGRHQATLAGGDLSKSPAIKTASSEPADHLVDGAVYEVTLQYQDTVPNEPARAIHANFRYDITPPVISSVAPVGNMAVSDNS